MGRSFSAQSADLHGAWGMYKHRHMPTSLGDLKFTQAGFPYRESGGGRVFMLWHFWDNVLIACNFPDDAHEKLVSRICSLLEKAWGLRVLYECGEACTHTYHHTIVTAGDHRGEGMAYLHPSSLDSDWNVKQGPPPKFPQAQCPGYVSAIFARAVVASSLWCLTWNSQLTASEISCTVGA